MNPFQRGVLAGALAVLLGLGIGALVVVALEAVTAR
jgi:hypothetical protein